MTTYKSTVTKGQQLGRTLGFPTLNLNPSVLPAEIKHGIYSSTIQIHGKEYKAALYLGPRLVLGETHPVLEIHVLNFHEEIYGEEVIFTIGDFIRDIANLPSLEDMKQQLKKDIDTIDAL